MPIEHRPRADLGEHGGIERIRRHRDQHFVARPRERGEGELDAFRGPRGDDHAIRVERHAAPRALGGDRFARRRDADRRRVAVVPVADGAFDRLDEVRRGAEPEGDRVADVQVADLAAGRLDLPRLRDDVADGVDEAADAAGNRDRGGRAGQASGILPATASERRVTGAVSWRALGYARGKSVTACKSDRPQPAVNDVIVTRICSDSTDLGAHLPVHLI